MTTRSSVTAGDMSRFASVLSSCLQRGHKGAREAAFWIGDRRVEKLLQKPPSVDYGNTGPKSKVRAPSQGRCCHRQPGTGAFPRAAKGGENQEDAALTLCL